MPARTTEDPAAVSPRCAPESLANPPVQLAYVCIHCGHPVDSLYKQYSSSVLKIIDCSNCAHVADKYIEFEPIVIIIDIVLLSREAYRHVLYNTPFRIRWKLAVVLVLLESYILSKEKQHSHRHHDRYDEPPQLSAEQLFYMCFLLSCIDKLLLSLLLFALSHLHPIGGGDGGGGRISRANGDRRRRFANVVKCVTLGNVTKFFLLPSVIWHSNITAAGVQLHELLVGVYYVMALVQTISVLCRCSRWTGAAFVVAAMLVKSTLNSELNGLVDRWL